MEYATIAGNFYTITSKDGCTVTDATGTLSMTVDAGGQLTVQAPSDKLVYDDEQAIVFKATFNHALAALGLLGEGDKLPAGYTRAEFLESTGTQYIYLEGELTSTVACSFTVTPTKIYEGNYFCGRNENYYVYAKIINNRVAVGQIPYSNAVGFEASTQEIYNVELDRQKKRFIIRCGEEEKIYNNVGVASTPKALIFFAGQSSSGNTPVNISYLGHARMSNISVSHDGVSTHTFIVSLDNNGRPCLYDTVTRKPFYNSGTGQFVAGLTLAQAAQLGRKLPSSGGSLTVSLPEGYDSNEGVVNSLAQAEAKGWVLTIQTYAAQAAAATFALRRVWVRRQQDENGRYVAADGSRWQVDWCVDVIGADPETLGYERFRSVDVATEYWGLVPYEYPEEELSTKA